MLGKPTLALATSPALDDLSVKALHGVFDALGFEVWSTQLLAHVEGVEPCKRDVHFSTDAHDDAYRVEAVLTALGYLPKRVVSGEADEGELLAAAALRVARKYRLNAYESEYARAVAHDLPLQISRRERRWLRNRVLVKCGLAPEQAEADAQLVHLIKAHRSIRGEL